MSSWHKPLCYIIYVLVKLFKFFLTDKFLNNVFIRKPPKESNWLKENRTLKFINTSNKNY